jgi:hypothetical protein
MTNNYTYISSATDTTVSSRPCVLHSIVLGETAAGAITIKDGSTTVAVLKASIAEGDFILDVVIKNSLVVTTAAASKLTVAWQPLT